MMVGGIILLVIGVLGFLAVCIYAACMMPVWSAGRLADGGTDTERKEKHRTAFTFFLVIDDSCWRCPT